jgi:hypothetical protein
MSNVPIPKVELNEEALEHIAGGECTLQDAIVLLNDAKQTYETLVDFTSYVIERVVTSVNP